MTPTLHREYEVESAIAAFGPSRRRTTYCGGHFVVLDAVVLSFLTLRQETPQTKFVTPTELVWRPPERFDTPRDEIPWLPRDVRETRAPQTHEKIREHHVFVRPASSRSSYVYVGPAHLGSYSYSSAGPADGVDANFTLAEKLPRDPWERLGGYAGWQVDLNHSLMHVPVDDVAWFDALLRTALAEPVSHLIVTRYEADSLHLFLNPDRGWLMYLRELDDSGLYIRDPDSRRDEDDVYYEEPEENFQCTCGTDMTFPRSQTLPRERAAAVVREFFMGGGLPKSIDWFEM